MRLAANFLIHSICLLWATAAVGDRLCDAEEPPAASTATAEPVAVSDADWPWWRGPQRNGVAPRGQQPPLRWSEQENIAWTASIPGRGHGSPTVSGKRVFLPTADHERQVQAVLCFDRDTGERLWSTDVHRGAFETKGNERSSLASSTAACDGRRVFINFLHAGAIYTTALDYSGQRLWQTKVTDYVLHQGFGSSPAVYQSLVLVSADNKGTGLLVGLDRATGQIVWKRERPKLPNYTSPIVLSIAGRDQLLLTGCDLVTSLEPLTGKVIWEAAGATTECVTSTVTDGSHVFTSGGYPKNHLSAVKADGSGSVAWQNTSRVYVPSLLLRDGYLYAVLDAGVAVCWNAATGEERWKQRLGGTFNASPALAGDLIYAMSESGQTFVFKANPDKFEQAAVNQLGEDVYASPAICGGRIYLRAAKLKAGRREEALICIGVREAAGQ